MKRRIEKTVYYYNELDNYSFKNQNQDESYEESSPSKAWINLYEWFNSIVASFVIIFLIFTFSLRAVGVSGRSMMPTLDDKDWLAVTNWNYTPERGDIVVVTQPNELHEPIIKRVIGVGGDTVDIDFEAGKVFVNGTECIEPYVFTDTNKKYDVKFPLTVPKGYLFVMGDNRNGSLDSRSSIIGMIDERYILGKVVIRFFPMKKILYK